ncbi:MAG: type II toxin-antitoxin system HigB family toxin [Candidatus Riflebacteria bacterium]|nr:type II toxin-antitoxin system HigB family toxin [Candidatus Riflebacteria bacterium]
MQYIRVVHVISRKAFSAFAVKYPDSAEPLASWYRIISRNAFRNISELRNAFNSVDAVAGPYVFNIGGNKYRLVAAVHFNGGRVYIRHLMTHSEYDKGTWKK